MALFLGLAYVVTVKGASFWGPQIARTFDLTEEANVPTWFSSSLWLVAAFLAFVIFQMHRDRGYPNSAYWIGLVRLGLVLSAGDAGTIHESVGDILGRHLEGAAVLKFTFAGVFFGLGLLLAVGLLYLRFLIRLERRVRFFLILSAGLFVLGAVVVESIGAAVWLGTLERFPLGQNWPRMILYEELLEMLGVILLIHTFLRVVALDEAPYTAGAERLTQHSSPDGAGR
ncbi:MAG: hypothetical protein ACK4RZ_17895 [Paracoccaceae bacterium]